MSKNGQHGAKNVLCRTVFLACVNGVLMRPCLINFIVSKVISIVLKLILDIVLTSTIKVLRNNSIQSCYLSVFQNNMRVHGKSRNTKRLNSSSPSVQSLSYNIQADTVNHKVHRSLIF